MRLSPEFALTAIVTAGVSRVVVGVVDPDPHVSGQGLARLRQAGVEVSVGVEAGAVEEQLAPYLKHRRTGRPWPASATTSLRVLCGTIRNASPGCACCPCRT